MKTLVLKGLGAAISGFALTSGCIAANRPAAVPPGTPPSPAAALVVEADAAPPPESADAGDGTFDVGSIVAVLDAPALAQAKSAAAAGRWDDAARAVEAALAASAPEGDERLRWQYQLGRLRALAGDPAGAAVAFDKASATPWPLAPYARFAAAQAMVRAGRTDDGLERARAVPSELPIGPAAQLLAGEALEVQGDHEAAIALFRPYLASGRHPARWVDVALRMAQAILATGPDGTRAEEAALLARRVQIEAPSSPAAPRAKEIELHALALVPESRRLRPVPTKKLGAEMDLAAGLLPVEQLARATALADAQKNDDAEKALDYLLSPAAGAGPEVTCRATVLLGSVLSKKKERARAADLLGAAIDRCDAYPDAEVEALYSGGKASVSAGRCDEAVKRFARVEQAFPTHRFADDARVRAADCALELGDEVRWSAMLSSIADDYPDGDMIGEGLFRLALRRMVRGDWAGATAPLERAIKARPRERVYWAAGRAEYFRARALLALGQTAQAKDALAEVIRDYPLTFYMLEAYARLSELDPAAARGAIEAAAAREPEGSFAVKDTPQFHTAAFARAVELLRQGEGDLARKEVAQLGLLADDAPADALWAVALLYARAGSPQLSHGLPRARLVDWLEHWPSGRWRQAWEIAYPRPWVDIVAREAKKSGIDTSLAYAIMREESAFDPDAASPARAYGLMQMIVPTAKVVGKKLGLAPDESQLRRPEVNVALGCRFLCDLAKRFPDNPTLAIPAYNAGPGAPARWIAARSTDDYDLWVEQIPYEETRKYTKRVLTSYAAYLFLYEKDRLDSVLKLPKAVASR